MIYNFDCLEKLKTMHKNEVDYVLTSPPYNMNLRIRNGKYCSRQIVKEFSSKYEGFSDNLPIEEYYEFHKKVLKELLRITKYQIFYNIQPITGNKRALWKLIGEFSDNIKEIIIWDKTRAQPAMHEQVLNSQYEFIIVLSKDKNDSISRNYKRANFERGTLSNIFQVGVKPSKLKGFGATFPEEFVEKIIINFTKKEDVILDPFMGTGTVGVVCKRNNRKFIGIEINKKVFEFAKKRLEII